MNKYQTALQSQLFLCVWLFEIILSPYFKTTLYLDFSKLFTVNILLNHSIYLFCYVFLSVMLGAILWSIIRFLKSFIVIKEKIKNE